MNSFGASDEMMMRSPRATPGPSRLPRSCRRGSAGMLGAPAETGIKGVHKILTKKYRYTRSHTCASAAHSHRER